ncbi:deoxyuridine 5'-triphosphate nucleotidohydrolase [Alicyclobacillus hesperidum]|uniref:Deoxyuridine 5'-triphosphate nucleotidohydrolase n=1 Tax=Alicyclobacillus hesperidum TaxID=89784 RepID=A0A1H2SJT3_9BACL|nr:dUTP diphosphatase [Alicyclobacillus hesperidum]GLV12413.1 deoxyuridine 5'-triphosphate nucleotidohydrolase [Alicyclobacillus hesperidum]SDW31842.1 deoxyuridine 5'-triphosphate nucleotidohydrolase [Alicyclobacillus hesperidum]
MTHGLDVNIQVVSPLFRDEYMPQYASAGAAGMDLRACLDGPVEFRPGTHLRVPTGIAIGLPRQDVVALVYARSGWAAKHGIALTNGVGVIDSDYTGEIQVLLSHHGDSTVVIEPGDRIAQLVVAPIYVVHWRRVESLAATERGEGGFGSTGTR